MRFPPKAVIICFEEEERFNCKNNHECGKLADFQLDNMNKFNYKMLVVLLYISSKLGLGQVQLVWRRFK